jgi:hypothetical protein
MFLIAITAVILLAFFTPVRIISVNGITTTSACVVVLVVAFFANRVRHSLTTHSITNVGQASAIRAFVQIGVIVSLMAIRAEMKGTATHCYNVDFVVIAVVQRTTTVIIVATHNRYSIIYLFLFERMYRQRFMSIPIKFHILLNMDALVDTLTQIIKHRMNDTL